MSTLGNTDTLAGPVSLPEVKRLNGIAQSKTVDANQNLTQTAEATQLGKKRAMFSRTASSSVLPSTSRVQPNPAMKRSSSTTSLVALRSCLKQSKSSTSLASAIIPGAEPSRPDLVSAGFDCLIVTVCFIVQSLSNVLDGKHFMESKLTLWSEFMCIEVWLLLHINFRRKVNDGTDTSFVKVFDSTIFFLFLLSACFPSSLFI